MKTKITLSVIVATLVVFSGCSGKLDPTPKQLDISKERAPKLSTLISIKKDSTFSNVIASLNSKNEKKIILDKTKTKIIFDRNLDKYTPKEILEYIKVNYGVKFSLRKYSDRLYVVEEKEKKKKKDRISGDITKIPKLEFETNGELSYTELFNQLRLEGINIYTRIRNEEDSFSTDSKVPIFKGNLQQFLRMLSVSENLFITTEDNGIFLSDVKTKIYDLKLPKIKVQPVLSASGQTQQAFNSGGSNSESFNSNGSTGMNNTQGSQINRGQNSSGASANIGNSGYGEEVDPLSDLDEEIKAMFKDIVYNINMSSGTMNVTGTQEEIETVDAIVAKFQEIYSKHIQVEMHIYQVSLNDKNEFGVDYSALQSELLGSGVGASVVSAGTSFATGLTSGISEGAGSIGFAKNTGIISTIDDTGLTSYQAEKTQGVIFKYLNKFGRASVLTKPTLGTINNFPVKLDIIDSIDYVYKLSSTQTNSATTGINTNVATVEPEIRTIKTGFSLVLHPRIEDTFIKIALKSIVSNLNALTQYKYGVTTENPDGSILQLKDVSSREFAETVKIKEGEIAVIGGYQYTKKTSNKSGLPFTGAADSAFDALTSAKESATQKVEIVITLQAVAR